MLTRGKNVLIEDLSAGITTGRAPLFERFVLGNSSTLRGWNKYDLDPLGGNRMVHNSVEYRYGAFQVFYDTGAASGIRATPPWCGIRSGSACGTGELFAGRGISHS